MARRKRSSKALERAERRAAALTSIDPNLDLGNGLTLEGFYQLIQQVRQKSAQYNTVLSTVDAAYNALLDGEKVLQDQTEQMLLGVAFKYGKNSSEYEMAGGVRKAERKRRTTQQTRPYNESAPEMEIT
ncbi:MAG: hypothetical protein ACFB5Z_13770 [Elainellaceae cyanobacterium]